MSRLPTAAAFVTLLSLLAAGCQRETTVDADLHDPQASTPVAVVSPETPEVCDGVVTTPVTVGEGWVRFGDAAGGDFREVSARDVLNDPAAFADQTLRIRGQIAGVCQPRGCWMRIVPEGVESAAEDATLFVKFTCPIEDAPRLIPLEAQGRPVVVEGQVVIDTISEADARHLAEDAGKSPEEIAAIAGPQRTVRVMSPAATVDMGA